MDEREIEEIAALHASCLPDSDVTALGPRLTLDLATAYVRATASTRGAASSRIDGLTDTQRTCLEDAAVTRPWGPLTKEQRQQVRADLRAAAEKCGVTVPTKAAAL